jgi:hypothetical protein
VSKPRYKTVPITLPSTWAKPWYAFLDTVQAPYHRLAEHRAYRVASDVAQVIGVVSVIVFRVIFWLCKALLKVGVIVTAIVFGITVFGMLGLNRMVKRS